MAYFKPSKHTRGLLDYQERKQIEGKKQREEDLEALCIVGYASKLFKDDSTALAIHRGEYLVPWWMGDGSSLMIDRFDGRGHLSDLSEFDTTHAWNHPHKTHQLSEEEARIEAICDEERYLALRTDLMEEETKREEEQKRIQQSMGGLQDPSYYGAVAPTYGGNSTQSEEYDPTMPTEDDTERAERLARERAPTPEPEQPFMAPDSLHLPSGIETPATQKLNLIIERTASFIAKQNPQMEIVIKARQSNNPQFDFLNYDHYLNPYYRHVVKCIKEGKYVPAPVPKEPEKPEEDSDSDGEGYLHPGLLGSSAPPKKQLPPPVSLPPPLTRPTTASAQAYPTVHQMTYSTAQPPVSSSSNEVIYSTSVSSSSNEVIYSTPSIAPPVPDVAPPVAELVPSPIQEAPPPTDPTSGNTEMLAAYYANAASELVNAYLTALASSAPPPPPGSERQLQQPVEVPVSVAQLLPLPVEVNPGVIPGLNLGISTGLEDMAIYQNPEPVPVIIPPPPDIQPIIDKLAEFVAKNGDEFEVGIKTKGDSRFEFVNSWHSFNGYYEQKKIMYRQATAEVEAALLEAQKAPVSFSIKPRDIDERVLVGRSALPLEESDSEEELPEIRKPPIGSLDQSAGMTDLINLTKQQIALAMVEASMTKSDPPQMQAQKPVEPERPLWPRKEPPTTRPMSVDYNHGRPRPTPAPPSVPPPPRSRDFSRFVEGSRSTMLESLRTSARPRPKPTPPPPVSREELARKQAEKAKLEDKLAKATREKMAGYSKDRQLQMERRKKAALFMSRMKDHPGDGEYDIGPSEDRRRRQRRGSSRESERYSSSKTPRAYQVSFDIRSRNRSRSPSPPHKRPALSKSKPSSPSVGDPLVPFRKKSSSRESSPGSSNGAASSRGVLKNKDFHAGTLGGILQKKKPSVEERKARIKKLVESSKQSSSEVIEID